MCILSTCKRETAKDLSVEMLPALKVLSESLVLLHQSPELRISSTSHWLVGLSVLAQYKSKQNIPGMHKEVHKKLPVEDQVLLKCPSTHQELALVARGTASLLDFCTDLCLHNESCLDGQCHRGMVHATARLVHHLRDDLRNLSGSIQIFVSWQQDIF
ncbi:hypothetical protein PsorP6_003417 [Peronosclerospora sorghi]|uniref:Uncharacterized protein n=1 Tax=Peronosclerospora sorghi TaxID=230839 RepID=A0ACC0VPF8_9STRA|nr:hypothetical protein PsorP6_003417 [Peronosclerospora sorghi]